MLEITIPGTEFYDEEKEEFMTTTGRKIQMEHSLVSISKWESKWHRPFMKDGPKNVEELADYYRCMTLTKNVDPVIFYSISGETKDTIDAYINDKMTASWFSEKTKGRGSREIITSEVIYSWMVSLGIPFECEKWHINRLMVLIHMCSLDQNGGGKKMSRKDIYSQNRALNAARRQKLGTRG